MDRLTEAGLVDDDDVVQTLAPDGSDLDHYLDEFTFRFNWRTSRSRAKLFQRLVEQALAVDPVPYKKLVGGGEPWWDSSDAIRLQESTKSYSEYMGEVSLAKTPSTRGGLRRLTIAVVQSADFRCHHDFAGA